MLNQSIKGHRYVGLLGKLLRRRVNTQNAHSYNHWLSDKGELHSYVRMQQGEMHSYVRTHQGFMVVYGISGVSNASGIWQLQEQFQTKLDGKFTELRAAEARAEARAELRYTEIGARLDAIRAEVRARRLWFF
ncbi:hypothetical protein BGX38DRAFT_1144597 [Terfezia claveryi]|nr:hypothetical protein BGX38DRAFT_1144597 [Terfezia claveryi]